MQHFLTVKLRYVEDMSYIISPAYISNCSLNWIECSDRVNLGSVIEHNTCNY